MDKTQSFVIVQALEGDIDLASKLFDEYRQFYKQKPDLTQAKIFLTERIQKNESIIFLALDKRDQFSRKDSLGLGFLQLYPSFSSISMKRQWILNDLYVRQDVRGNGIAQALMNKAIEFARETKSKGLVLETAIDNYPAQKLYDKIGFKKETEFFTYYYNFPSNKE